MDDPLNDDADMAGRLAPNGEVDSNADDDDERGSARVSSAEIEARGPDYQDVTVWPMEDSDDWTAVSDGINVEESTRLGALEAVVQELRGRDEQSRTTHNEGGAVHFGNGDLPHQNMTLDEFQ